MAATISRLRTKDDRLREQDAAALRQMVIDFPDLPERAVGEIVATIDRETLSKSGWVFAMVGVRELKVVIQWLNQNSCRPKLATNLWAECFSELRRDTGEIMLSRSEMAERLGVSANDITRIMSELASINAIIKKREKCGVRYFMHPKAGTHLPGAARDKAQKDAPELVA